VSFLEKTPDPLAPQGHGGFCGQDEAVAAPAAAPGPPGPSHCAGPWWQVGRRGWARAVRGMASVVAGSRLAMQAEFAMSSFGPKQNLLCPHSAMVPIRPPFGVFPIRRVSPFGAETRRCRAASPASRPSGSGPSGRRGIGPRPRTTFSQSAAFCETPRSRVAFDLKPGAAVRGTSGTSAGRSGA